MRIVSISYNSLILISGTVVNICAINNILKKTIDMYKLTLDNWIFIDIPRIVLVSIFLMSYL